MKKQILIYVTIFAVALAGFFLYGRVEHTVGQPKGTLDYNCDDFDNRDEAQKFFLDNGGPDADPFRLDQDNDGEACNGHYYPKHKKLAWYSWMF